MKVNKNNINLKISDNFYKKRKEIFRFSKSVFLNSIPRNNDYILDIGCGSGLNSNKLSKLGYSPIGIDLSFVGLNSYKKKYSCICQDLDYGLCIKNSSFNYVFMSEVIEHLNYTDMVLGEIKRILKKMDYYIYQRLTQIFGFIEYMHF